MEASSADFRRGPAVSSQKAPNSGRSSLVLFKCNNADTTYYSCHILPGRWTNKRHWSYVSCVPHSCQLVSAALYCSYSTVVLTNQRPALQLFSVAVSPHKGRCAGWLAMPVRTRASIRRFAHSTVRSLITSSHGSQLMTQAVQLSQKVVSRV